MKQNNNFPVQSQNSGIKVICDETNNSEQDRIDCKMNVDIIIPKYPIDMSKVEEIKQQIASSVGIPKEELYGIKPPEENDGGIGQGGL